MIFPTAEDRLVDASGRVVFLWDDDVTLTELRSHLNDADDAIRGYWEGKLLRQARPDDVVRFASLDRLRLDWAQLERYLGRTREMWRWLLFESGWTGA